MDRWGPMVSPSLSISLSLSLSLFSFFLSLSLFPIAQFSWIRQSRVSQWKEFDNTKRSRRKGRWSRWWRGRRRRKMKRWRKRRRRIAKLLVKVVKYVKNRFFTCDVASFSLPGSLRNICWFVLYFPSSVSFFSSFIVSSRCLDSVLVSLSLVTFFMILSDFMGVGSKKLGYVQLVAEEELNICKCRIQTRGRRGGDQNKWRNEFWLSACPPSISDTWNWLYDSLPCRIESNDVSFYLNIGLGYAHGQINSINWS